MGLTLTRTAPPATPSTYTATAVNGWDKCYSEESGTLVDRTTEFITVGSDVEIFADDNDYVYFSIEVCAVSSNIISRVMDIHLVFSQFANTSILPTFEYNTGDNAWATLSVTDDTNGFTQNGTIHVNLATLPTYTGWARGSQDGSGNEIGDGVDRRYIRIKRTVDTLTTKPKISESGSGLLSASKTYYYKAITSENSTIYANGVNSMRRSAPTPEFSATTTTVKRTIKVEVDTGGKYFAVWRTPTSGNYVHDAYTGNTTYTSFIDSECQTVKGDYFRETCADRQTGGIVFDNGIANGSTRYYSTRGQYRYYVEILYNIEGRGLLTATSDDSVNYTMKDFYDECQTQGWTDAIQHLDLDSKTQVETYRICDNLDIRCGFKDDGLRLYLKGVISTFYMAEGKHATFGRRNGSTGYYYYDKGCDFILVGNVCYNGKFYFKETYFYSCNFTQSAVMDSRTYCHFPKISDDCELYDCMFDGIGILEGTGFIGQRLVLKNNVLSRARYGLVINKDYIDDWDMEGFTIQGGTALYASAPNWYGGDVIRFKNFQFKFITKMVTCYSQASNDSQVTLDFINPVLDSYSSFSSATVGLTWRLNRKYELDLKVIDRNGDAVETATVVLKDKDGVTRHTLTTDVNGNIDTTEVLGKYSVGGTVANSTYHQYYSDDITTLAPYTVEISKTGYYNNKVILPLEEKTTEVLVLDAAKDYTAVSVDTETLIMLGGGDRKINKPVILIDKE